jgi:hypothetical protein
VSTELLSLRVRRDSTDTTGVDLPFLGDTGFMPKEGRFAVLDRHRIFLMPHLFKEETEVWRP